MGVRGSAHILKGLAIALALVLSLAWAMTPAGTAISNQASASYIDSAGQPRTRANAHR